MTNTEARRKLDALFGDAPAREPSRALPSGAYRDPAEYLEHIEAKSCRGCKFEKTVIFQAQNKVHIICLNRTSNGKRRDHGRRCEDFIKAGA